ncbi:MAG: ATP-binding cassette domain-containing protein [Lactobacillaceae bacterium]|nr:ATP-binding cassette domain-containing protein [Lactobacillaceae bacterium]
MLKVQEVSKVFIDGKKEFNALNQVSFDVQAGEIFGFVGANGAGKSTTMRIIMGVLAANAGEVYVDDVKVVGEHVNESAAAKARQTIGYMPSERGLYPKMQVMEQLEFFGQLKGLSAKEAHEQVEQLMTDLNVMAHKDKLLKDLSTGNAQRVQLVVALLGQPKILILDEPFSGLDPIAVRHMSDSIKAMAQKGVAVIFSSHQLELIDELCDRVGIINHGDMLHVGTPDELRAITHAQPTITIPTPLANIFGDLMKGDA